MSGSGGEMLLISHNTSQVRSLMMLRTIVGKGELSKDEVSWERISNSLIGRLAKRAQSANVAAIYTTKSKIIKAGGHESYVRAPWCSQL